MWAARGKGTFVADAPVDIPLDNLSSFSAQMQAAGHTDDHGGARGRRRDRPPTTPDAADRRSTSRRRHRMTRLTRITRRRSADGLAFALQRSYLRRSTITVRYAVGNELALRRDRDGHRLGRGRGARVDRRGRARHPTTPRRSTQSPAIRPSCSMRTSINQFGQPFLHDEALLVGGRCTITADRRSDRLSLTYRAN